MFLEIIGVGLVIPAINLLIKSDIITEYPQLNPIMNYFNNPTHLQLIVIGMIVIVIVYLIKNLFISYFLWYQNNYSYGIQLSLAKKLYENYLYQPYAFHLRRNSAVLMRNIEESVSFTQSAFQMTIIAISEVLVFFGIVILLFEYAFYFYRLHRS